MTHQLGVRHIIYELMVPLLRGGTSHLRPLCFCCKASPKIGLFWVCVSHCAAWAQKTEPALNVQGQTTEHLSAVDRGWHTEGNQRKCIQIQRQLNSHLPLIQREQRLMDITGFSVRVKNVNAGLTFCGVSRQAVSNRLRQQQSNHQGSLSADYQPFRWVWREASCLWAREALFICSAKLIWR